MYKITHSLLSSWQYATSEDAREGAYEDFLSALRGVRKEPTEAMLKGREFEDAVYAFMSVNPAPDSPDRDAIVTIGTICKDASVQVRVEKQEHIGNDDFLLVGVLDCLSGGVIYDIKRTSSQYEYGKYQDSTQHPMYFRLVPNARMFSYLIYDGYRVYREDYYPADTEPIETIILSFLDYLRAADLMDVYKEHWSVYNGD